MKRLLMLLSLLLCSPALAQEPDSSVIQDSVYFTMDDGIQSEEEMVAEADYVRGICVSNPYQAMYFDCDCLAGAFLQQREKLGPMTPQYQIVDELTKSKKAVCGNSAAIAGDTYRYCMDRAKTNRELLSDKEKESYCTCAANKTAKDFAKYPRLDITYIRRTKANALAFCRDPQRRPVAKEEPKSPLLQ